MQSNTTYVHECLVYDLGVLIQLHAHFAGCSLYYIAFNSLSSPLTSMWADKIQHLSKMTIKFNPHISTKTEHKHMIHCRGVVLNHITLSAPDKLANECKLQAKT